MTSALEIYQEVKRGTGTPRGISWWSLTTSCGKRRALTQLHQALAEAAETHEEEKMTGTFYHGLLDFWQKGRLPNDMAIDLGPIQDTYWAEAVRLFNFHREHFPKGYWGEYVDSEIKLPFNEEHRQTIVKFFGHDEITGAVDAAYMLSAEDVARIETDRKITLNGPGLYFIDWKTSGQRKSAYAGESNYTSSMQALTYPVLWNLMGGEECKGMIFDILVKHAKLRRHDVDPKNLSSVQTFFAPYRPENNLIVKNGIDVAMVRRNEAKADPFGCYGMYGACPFLNSGLCGRY